ncbi:MAG: hypothetical protein ACI8P9_000336 [Parasphingorhabdus sp.]|jgi:hypothetical protein
MLFIPKWTTLFLFVGKTLVEKKFRKKPNVGWVKPIKNCLNSELAKANMSCTHPTDQEVISGDANACLNTTSNNS